MTLILPIGAILCTGVITLVMLVFCSAMGANASPASIAALKRWMIGLSLLSLTATIAALVLMRSQPNLAASIAIVPSLLIAVIFIASLLKGK